MKTTAILLFSILLITQCAHAQSVNQWTFIDGDPNVSQIPDYGIPGKTGSRQGVATWTDTQGNLWLFGGAPRNRGGFNGPPNFYSDLWKYDQATKFWTYITGDQVTDIAGDYGTNPNPGGRMNAATWTDGAGNFWLFGGFGYGDDINSGYGQLNDLWMFNVTTKAWIWKDGSTQIGDEGTSGGYPSARFGSATWKDAAGNFWLFGGDNNDGFAPLSDLWKRASNGIWTLVKNTGADTSRYGQRGVASATNSPGQRYAAASWIDASNKLWLYGGYGIGHNSFYSDPDQTLQFGDLADLWKFDPVTSNWTWMQGDSLLDAPASYGAPGIPAATKTPGARHGSTTWTDARGDFWMFGGGYVMPENEFYNQLWRYNVASGQWAWLKGNVNANMPSITSGQPDVSPGSRGFSGKWATHDTLWLFGGGNDSYASYFDLWSYKLPCPPALTLTPSKSSFCQGVTSIQLTATGAANYVWYHNDTIMPSVTGASYLATDAGSYVVKSTDPVCGDQYSYASLLDSATVRPILAGDGIYCISQSVSIGLNGTQRDQTYQWVKIESSLTVKGPQNGDGTNQSLSFNLASADVGRYAVLTKKAGCEDRWTDTVTVRRLVVEDLKIDAVNATSVTFDWKYIPPTGFSEGKYYYAVSTESDPFLLEDDSVFEARDITTITKNFLTPNTLYYIHVRTDCTDPNTGLYQWVTLSFNTCGADIIGTLSPDGPLKICTGQTIQLTAGGGGTYQWMVNDTLIQGQTGVNYLALAAGVYKVIVKQGVCGGVVPDSVIIEQGVAPAGTINPAGPVNICQGSSSSLSTVPGYTYEWYQDGVLVPTVTVNSYSVSQAGVYRVKIIDGGCSAFATNDVTVTVTTVPAAVITPAGPLAICGSSTTLTATAGGASYDWRLNGTTISTQPGNTFNATQPGSYSVIVHNSSCAAPASNSVDVTFNPIPSASISPAGPIVICGSSTTLTATIGGTSYDWLRNNVIVSTQPGNTYSATQSGTYTVVIHNGTCSAPGTNSVDVTLTAAPTANISPAGPLVICGGSTTLTATIGGTSYDWLRNNVIVSTQPGNTYSATQSGTYTVVIHNGTCSAPGANAVDVTLTAAPTANISPAGPLVICGGSTTLTATAGGTSYDWLRNNVVVSTQPGNTYNATQSGAYTVVIHNGTCSAPGTNSVDVTLTAAPTANISPAGPLVVCGGSSTLTATIGGTSYDWLRNNVIVSTQPGNTYSATQSGAYTVVIHNGTCSAPGTNSVDVTLTAAPTANISPAGPLVVCGGSSTLTATIGGTSYDWLRNNVIVSTQPGNTYSATQSGTYTVIIHNGTCSAPGSNSVDVTLTAAPTANISPAGPLVVCGGSSTLTATIGGTSYDWLRNNVIVSTQPGNTYSATQSGTYTVIIHNGTCSAPGSNSVDVTLTAAPTANISPAGPLVICGGSTTLTATIGGTSYDWLRNNVIVSTQPGNTYSATQSGTYTVVIHNGTCSAPGSNGVDITLNPIPSSSLTPVGPLNICPGGSTTLTASGSGTSYDWLRDGSPFVTTTVNTLAVNQAGTYSIIIHKNNCDAPGTNAVLVNITTIAPAIISPVGPVTICSGESQTLIATPGGSQYDWYLNGNPVPVVSTNALDATQAGNYTVVIHNGSCSAPPSAPVTINVTALPTGNISPAGPIVLCPAGTQTLTATGGGSYEWSRDGNILPGVTGSTCPATLAGTYSVVIHSGSCSAPASNAVSVSIAAIPVSTISPAGPIAICPGGTQTLTTTSGGSSYEWFIDGNPTNTSTTNQYPATLAGTYSVIVRYGACAAAISNGVTISITNAPAATISPAGPLAICTGTAQTLTATAGGTQYDWFINASPVVGITANTLPVTVSGTYSVTVHNGTCVTPATNTVSIIVNPSPTGAISPAGPINICPGGQQTLTATGGTSYEWFRNGSLIPGVNGNTCIADQSGVYSATIHSTTCVAPASNTVTVNVSTFPVGSISPAGPLAFCSGQSQTLTATPGGSLYDWSLNGNPVAGVTGNTITANQAGTYSVVIHNGTCSNPASNTVTITINATPAGAISPAGPVNLCQGSTQVLTVTSGASSYEWFRNAVLISGVSVNTYTADQPGTYSVIIHNGNCSGPASNAVLVNVTPLPAGPITPAGPINICSGSTQTLTAPGNGSGYDWMLNGTVIATTAVNTYVGDQTGTYTVIIHDGSCSGAATNAVDITVVTSPTGTISPAGTINICAGETQTLTATAGGSTYDWFLDGNPIANVTGNTYAASATGTYSVIIHNGTCSGPATNNVTVSVRALPVGGISPSGPITICTGSSQILTATGGTSYDWFIDGNPIANVSGDTYTASDAGLYSVVIHDNLCSAAGANAVSVSITLLPTASISPAGPINICAGQSQTLTATGGGTSYDWFLNGIFQPGISGNTCVATQSGIYTVTIHKGDCSATSTNSVSVSITALPNGSISPAGPLTICAGTSQLLTATTGGTRYDWFLNGSLINNVNGNTCQVTQSGTYSVTMYSGNCHAPASNTVSVSVTPLPNGTISPAGPLTICAGTSQTLTATPGATSYEWFLDGNVLTGITGNTCVADRAGSYSVVLHAGDCNATSTNTVSVSVVALPAGGISPAGPIAICEGATQTLTANGGDMYDWYKDGVIDNSSHSETFVVSTSGVYSVVIKNSQCSGAATNQVSVSVTPLPNGSITPASINICTGTTTSLSVSGGTTYQWYRDGQPIASAVQSTLITGEAGSYEVEIFTAGGCHRRATNTSIVSIQTKPVASFNFSTACSDRPVQFNNTSTGSDLGWRWDFGDQGSATELSPSHLYATAGSYDVTLIVTSNRCPQLADTMLQTVRVADVIPGERYPIVRVVKGVPFKLTARDIGTEYRWRPATGLDDANVREPLLATDQPRDFLIQITTQQGCETVDSLHVDVFGKPQVFVPTAFTPNGNSANDVLRPLCVSIVKIDYFRVYNRWGQMIYETHTLGEGWDGKFKSVPQPPEAYSWIFVGVDSDSKTIKTSGKTVLIR